MHFTQTACKVLCLRGELFVVNGSCAEMKAEHLRKFRKFGVSRWSEMAFSEFSRKARHVRDKINHQFHKKYADFEDFLEIYIYIYIHTLFSDASPDNYKSWFPRGASI
jgi:hypothetical protein